MISLTNITNLNNNALDNDIKEAIKKDLINSFADQDLTKMLLYDGDGNIIFSKKGRDILNIFKSKLGTYSFVSKHCNYIYWLEPFVISLYSESFKKQTQHLFKKNNLGTLLKKWNIAYYHIPYGKSRTIRKYYFGTVCMHLVSPTLQTGIFILKTRKKYISFKIVHGTNGIGIFCISFAKTIKMIKLLKREFKAKYYYMEHGFATKLKELVNLEERKEFMKTI